MLKHRKRVGGTRYSTARLQSVQCGVCRRTKAESGGLRGASVVVDPAGTAEEGMEASNRRIRTINYTSLQGQVDGSQAEAGAKQGCSVGGVCVESTNLIGSRAWPLCVFRVRKLRAGDWAVHDLEADPNWEINVLNEFGLWPISASFLACLV